MVEVGYGSLQPKIERDADQLERQQHQRECDEGQRDQDDTDHENGSLRIAAGAAGQQASRAGDLNATGMLTKKCGPGQTRRLTGTAWGRVICDGGPDQTQA